jgi:HD-GYP domain-containing protein (c-di-GMP phosphodiesterase class II)
MLGRALGLGESQLERLHFGALLHDVGMLKLDQRHTGAQAYKAHAALGHRMLSRIRLWEDLAPMVLYHHEWWDGRGYPEGLTGDAIPLEARLIGLAEAFDSMLSTTSYRQARSFESALQEIRDGRGTQFDPQVTDVFLDLVERGQVERPTS